MVVIAAIYIQDQTIDTLWPQTYFEGGFVTTSNFRSDIMTEAVYAQGTYSLIDQLRVTAGFRYTWEDVDFEQLSQGAAFGAPGQSESFEEPSWELGLEYDISDAFFAYGKVRSSFRSGGFNGAAPVNDADATAGGNKFDQETVEDIEVGLKFDGELASRPARGSIAVYKTVIEDVQRIEFSGAVFAKNLTDEEYFAGGMALAASLGHNSTAVGEPRTYGVELSYKF